MAGVLSQSKPKATSVIGCQQSSNHCTIVSRKFINTTVAIDLCKLRDTPGPRVHPCIIT